MYKFLTLRINIENGSEMAGVQEKLRNFMTKLSHAEEKRRHFPSSESVSESSERDIAEEQKRLALSRLGNRTISRPEKKDADLLKSDGKYVKPDELKTAPAEGNELKKPVDKGLAALIKKLRGVRKQKKETFSSKAVAENGFKDVESGSSGAKADEGASGEAVATALSVAVGIVYWDERDRLADRIITVRRLFKRGEDILIDAFCHDLQVPRMILFSRVVRLYDIRSLKPYPNSESFLLSGLAGISADGRKNSSCLIEVLSVVRYELAVLAFVARAGSEKSDYENGLILNYVRERCADIPFDTDEILNYIALLYPDEQSFYEAVDVVVKQPRHVLQPFVETFLQLITADGVIHDNERELLAELLYILRSEGIELNILGLR